jgi:hypothetical protein
MSGFPISGSLEPLPHPRARERSYRVSPFAPRLDFFQPLDKPSMQLLGNKLHQNKKLDYYLHRHEHKKDSGRSLS